MSRENDTIEARIGCMRTDLIPATLIATSGYHCEVWRAVGTLVRRHRRTPIDIVVKVHRVACNLPEVRVIGREYTRLRRALGPMVPITRFVATRIDGEPSIIALAESVNRWFDVANPANESEAVPLFRRLRRARAELDAFVATARDWDDREDRVIDLYGLENLVLDNHQRLRYIDSFRVFFYADVLYAVDPPDEGLRERIERSRNRLSYLTYLLDESA